MITETEAKQAVVALGTAMLNDDKKARELIYSDMDADSLKRIIRWAMRQNLQNFAVISLMSGIDPKDAWAQLAMLISMTEDGDDDSTQ
jgi:hypothetical protein